MSWHKLKTIQPSRVTGVTVRITGKGYDGVPHLVIRIARELAEEAGIEPHRNSRVDVLIGEGGDAGQMRIANNPKGDCGCHPQGKAGALKIALAALKPLPGEYETMAVEATIEDGGGLTFQVPWYKRAADREVEDDDLPTAADVRGILTPPPLDNSSAATSARRAQGYPHGPPKKLGGETASQTLDAIEEDARPLTASECESEMARARRLEDAFVAQDAAVNGSAKAHVYVDSFTDQAKIKFTHKNKSCLMTKRQHAFASALHKAMQKAPPGSHIANETLLKEIDTKELSVLISTAIAVEGLVAPLGLEIGVIRKTGYWMKEG